jgi:hypothetical protein
MTPVFAGNWIDVNADGALPRGPVPVCCIRVSKGAKPAKVRCDPFDCRENGFHDEWDCVLTIEAANKLSYAVAEEAAFYRFLVGGRFSVGCI